MAGNVGEGVVMLPLKKQIKIPHLELLCREKLIFLGGCQETAKLILKADVPLVARMWRSPGMRTCTE